MLVLSRKADERIIINENIVVTVVRIEGDKVRLGIAAPREIPIRREELPALVPAASDAHNELPVVGCDNVESPAAPVTG
jgi:carbon storage regulator